MHNIAPINLHSSIIAIGVCPILTDLDNQVSLFLETTVQSRTTLLKALFQKVKQLKRVCVRKQSDFGKLFTVTQKCLWLSLTNKSDRSEPYLG